MFKVLLLFIILTSGVILGPVFLGKQFYVLIQTHEYNIETNIAALTTMLILLVAILLCIKWIILQALSIGSRARFWFMRRKLKSIQ
ncbi:heme biosynthesis HemY N-terminal domain-containing protein [Candidatus Profftia tarda]|uniref:heme biosynthesis HemY N-terminal domain-containing protein n=1 Tax=Candidatus Profftia tarda TaxID=1177216 RepID=UPI001C1F7383|nr:heme biosynthesis HemY N-terminal domain-containing protein [Candidatus Profftia tarda]